MGFEAQLLVRTIAAPAPEALLAEMGRDLGAALLESGPGQAADARWTILGVDPVEHYVLSRGSAQTLVDHLARRTAQLPGMSRDRADVPFRGGWIGYLSYDSGLDIEGVRSRHARGALAPDAAFALYDTALIIDHASGAAHLVAIDWPPGVFPSRAPAPRRLEALAFNLESAPAAPRWTETGYVERGVGQGDRRGSAAPMETAFDEQSYRAAVDRARRYIEAGDIYQVNLSQRFMFVHSEAPTSTYARLRAVNPASHSALIRAGDATILSASPELFLRLSGDRVVTRPIKGTRPRGGVDAVDRAARRELERDEKELAELNMIVDLLRNDLGRVCRPGSVGVVDPGAIEAHPTVFHRVATIEGRLDRGQTWRDLLLASFPGGSITGAPKVRAMRIIDELEPFARGAYCGAIGWIGLDGDMGLNVAIRTMVQGRDRVYAYAGGAITWDSDPDREYAEILAKARGLFRSLDFVDGAPRGSGLRLVDGGALPAIPVMEAMSK